MRRTAFLQRIDQQFRVNPVLALLGPRQCGKTTLAKDFAKGKKATYFDLENPRDLARLDNPMLALEGLRHIVIIDEIQRRPDLFPILRVLVDQQKRKVKYLILGSASRDLIQQSSESLAGRISYLSLTPFQASEIPLSQINQLWFRGGFPPSFLASSHSKSAQWRRHYISTFLERDIPNLGFNIPAQTLRRFWMMLTHYHGQVLNTSDIGRSMGLSHPTIRRYLDLLSGTFMIRQLNPWHENLKKRQVKSPKIYFRDAGLYHSLLDVEGEKAFRSHPKLGASWEGFAIEEIIRRYHLRDEDVFFWATHNQAELDLFFIYKGKRMGFEIKYTDSPKLTKSMKIAQKDLELKELTLVYPGRHAFPLAKGIKAKGLDTMIISP